MRNREAMSLLSGGLESSAGEADTIHTYPEKSKSGKCSAESLNGVASRSTRLGSNRDGPMVQTAMENGQPTYKTVGQFFRKVPLPANPAVSPQSSTQEK